MRTLVLVLTVALLAGCAALPHDGPSARSIGADAERSYAVVDLDYRVSQIVAATPPGQLATLAAASSTAPNDLIGEGDVLAVWIDEAGSAQGDVGGETFRLTVGRGGFVNAPLAGPVAVSGLTPQQASEVIQRALRSRAVNPQVIVAVETNMSNTVTVIGDVRESGRIPLSPVAGRLLDVLASAGGATKAASDVVVTVARAERTASVPLNVLLEEPEENIRLASGDQVRVAYKPRKFNTFGAFVKASQVEIGDESLTLAGAMSRIGGLDAASANAESVVLFRFERPEVARALGLDSQPTSRGVPVIYRVNLRDPTGYFVAGMFEVTADDLIYVPHADAAELRKFFDLVMSMTRVAYDLRVTSVIP